MAEKVRRQPCRIRGNEFAHGFLIRHLRDDVLSIVIKGVTYHRMRRRDAIGYPTFEAVRR